MASMSFTITRTVLLRKPFLMSGNREELDEYRNYENTIDANMRGTGNNTMRLPTASLTYKLYVIGYG